MSSEAKVTFVTSNKGKAREVEWIFKRNGLPLKVFYSETVEIQSEEISTIAVFRAMQAYTMLRR
ncbi:MAG: hypothetical protein QXH12_04220, partial [Candidatus Caldarchaeum sp.]